MHSQNLLSVYYVFNSTGKRYKQHLSIRQTLMSQMEGEFNLFSQIAESRLIVIRVTTNHSYYTHIY